MRIRSLLQCLILCAAAAAGGGGCRTAPIYEVIDAPVSNADEAPLSLEVVGKAIRRAGLSLGWTMERIEPGIIVGTLRLRSHVAQVTITYDEKTYSIRYKASQNLHYTGTRIHANYNGWIQNLDRSIQSELLLP
jgi:hypothetical protein